MSHATVPGKLFRMVRIRSGVAHRNIDERERTLGYGSGKPLAELPKRKPGSGRTYDKEAASELYKLVNARIGATATDDTAYAEKKDAMNESAKARRLIQRAMPESETRPVKTKVYEDGDKFRWAVYFGKKGETPSAEDADEESDASEEATTESENPLQEAEKTPAKQKA